MELIRSVNQDLSWKNNKNIFTYIMNYTLPNDKPKEKPIDTFLDSIFLIYTIYL